MFDPSALLKKAHIKYNNCIDIDELRRIGRYIGLLEKFQEDSNTGTNHEVTLAN